MVLRSGVLTTLDFNEVDVTYKSAKIVRLVLFGEGKSADGWGRC